MVDKKIIIAGPSSFESKTQIVICTQFLKDQGVDYFRAPLWKPRSNPGWDGIGFFEIPFLVEECLRQGLVPATEVFSSIQAQMLVDVMRKFGQNDRMLVWIGSRNQNHFELRRIVKIISDSTIELMFKNQMWVDPKHWYGIYEHILEAGFPKSRLMACHRGFMMQAQNVADFPLAQVMQQKMKIPMIIDVSHIASNRDKIYDVLNESEKYSFNGYMVEVSENPEKAILEKDLQLNFREFEVFQKIVSQAKSF